MGIKANIKGLAVCNQGEVSESIAFGLPGSKREWFNNNHNNNYNNNYKNKDQPKSWHSCILGQPPQQPVQLGLYSKWLSGWSL